MNYKKVIEDFNSGVLNKKTTTLVMNKNGGYWSYQDGNISYDKCEYITEMLEKKYGSPSPVCRSDTVDILIAAGVNADWCFNND